MPLHGIRAHPNAHVVVPEIPLGARGQAQGFEAAHEGRGRESEADCRIIAVRPSFLGFLGLIHSLRNHTDGRVQQPDIVPYLIQWLAIQPDRLMNPLIRFTATVVGRDG